MSRAHHYAVTIEWTGNLGTGTSSYRAYSRSHEICGDNASKPAIPGSSDPSFRGDPARWNPEELLVSALSACHKLSYLHLCADEGIVVTAYVDRAEGVMNLSEDGAGRFERVTLHPRVSIAPGSDVGRARDLHEIAHHKCFIANSVNFPVDCVPKTVIAVAGG